MKLKIAIVVHGRFHAFDLARALIDRGHIVTLFTNYPKWAVKRFGLCSQNVQSCWLHGVFSRVAVNLYQCRLLSFREDLFNVSFARWAHSKLRMESWDVVYVWSGIAEEILKSNTIRAKTKLLVRGSSHISFQKRLLKEEEIRSSFAQESPGEWIVSREEREYELADAIVVLSSFSYQSFVSQGVAEERLRLLRSATRVELFRPPYGVILDRCQRINSGAPVRVITVGTFSFRKGSYDLAAVAQALGTKDFQFRFVGTIAPEASRLAKDLKSLIRFVPRQPQWKLPYYYSWADLFLNPTVEDGFQAVLAQAEASALPVITTPNGGGCDLVREGENGWIVPIRDPQAIIQRMEWCSTHRDQLAGMVKHTYQNFRPRDWIDMAADFESIVSDHSGKTVSQEARHAG